jgi:nascent polypeptide-associated complex subunit alpha
LANAEAGKFKKAEKPSEAPKKDENEKADDNEEAENEEGVDADMIDMVVDHCKCSRAKAVKALKKHNNDSVNAILELSNE